MLSRDMAKPLLGHSTKHDENSIESGQTIIGILGTGDFARSLASRLLYSGFQVVVGSRYPKRSINFFPATADVTTQEDAISKADIFFVALHQEHYSTLCDFKDGLSGKVLVDVSNKNEVNMYSESNAEYLASLFPDSVVVKGFNVISAWSLQNGPKDGCKQVLISGDTHEAKSKVIQIARAMGFIPLDMGSLSAAREIENIPLRMFPSWKMPLVLGLCLFVFFYCYNFIRSVLHPYVTEQKNKFYKIPIELVNVTLPCVAYVMLSLVYLPGILAACYQLHYGTKYRRFQEWLDRWLLHRKYIGLVSFYFAVLHAVYSLCLPLRRSHRYEILNEAYSQVKADKENAWVEEEVWRMELYLSFGIIAIGILSLLAVTSLPSVGNSLNWREFTFIQSKLGYAALIVSTIHVLIFGWKRVFDGKQYKFYLPPTFTLALILPCVVLLSKMFLLLPCLNQRLARIRRGWEKDHYIRFKIHEREQQSFDLNLSHNTVV
ncbi:metalloreductase STEAP3 [Protopterus annectens]|uniref:metalloreductase STEAP3 n=1 Tax=Protopterus annectens TaxID=7888 RepID=UPI001CFA8799|nr:metalloreductase STEAP3 [Protopterus annectens]